MGYDVRTVRDRRTMRDFLRLPERIYRGDPNYVPPLTHEVRRTLDARKNPYFVQAILKLLVCYRDGIPAARTALVINARHEQKFGVRAAFFGFFESIDDPAAAQALFATARHFCQSHRATLLEGPFNPNHYSELGLLLDHYSRPPTFFQTYNPPYYRGLLEAAGFSLSATLFTARNERIAATVAEQFTVRPPVPEAFVVRHLDLRNRAEEMEKIREVFNDAFAANWHFLPANKDEYDFSAKFIHLITEPDLIWFVEHHGQPVGVALCVLDVNPLLRHFRGRPRAIALVRFLRGKRRVPTALIYAVGIRKRYHGTRVSTLLLDAVARTLGRFESAESTWMSEHNTVARRAVARLGMKEDKHFGIFALHLVPDVDGGTGSSMPAVLEAHNE